MIDDQSSEECKRSRGVQIAIEHANESITMAKIELLQSLERIEKLIHHDKGTRD